MLRSLVGSEMCIRDSSNILPRRLSISGSTAGAIALEPIVKLVVPAVDITVRKSIWLVVPLSVYVMISSIVVACIGSVETSLQA